MKLEFMEHINDLKQREVVTDKLVTKILYSKRLLVDHVESLECCLVQIQENKNSNDIHSGKNLLRNVITSRNACIVIGSTLLECLLIPKSMKFITIPSILLSGSFSTLYIVKNIFKFRNKIVERQLDHVICTVDAFGNCIRRNMTYFNEILIMKTAELIESRQCERAWDCITTTKEVIEILYDGTRKLEEQFPLPVKYSEYYSPMEELRECDYFKTNITDYCPKNIKDFYNIFSYVQSQFFLRLALTLMQRPSLSVLSSELSKIDCQIEQLVLEEESHFQNLAIDLNKKQQLQVNEFHTTKTMKNKSGPEAVLQESSLKLSACMMAVATECTQLDSILHHLALTESAQKDNSRNLIEVANRMHAIENSLAVCFEDFQRLMLVYNKFLNHKLPVDNVKPTVNDDMQTGNSESILRVEISEENEKNDDFYAYMYDEKQEAKEIVKENENNNESEILNFEKRVTKTKFKPVMKQLMNRIDPIRQEMLEKERKVLALKGINVDELFGKDNENYEKNENRNTASDNSTTNSDEGSADEIDHRQTKIIKERDNFAEMRNFLAQKEAINLFQTNSPPQISSNETILE